MVKVKESEREDRIDQSVVWVVRREGKDEAAEVYEHAYLGAHEALYLTEARRKRFCRLSVHSSFKEGGRQSS